MDETEDSIDIKVNYKRKVNYEHLAECSISMNIMSKDAKDFRIWVYKSHPQRMALIHKNVRSAYFLFKSILTKSIWINEFYKDGVDGYISFVGHFIRVEDSPPYVWTQEKSIIPHRQ